MYYHLPVLRDDREVMLAAVQQGGGALAFASVVLRRDRKVVLAAVQQSWRAIEFASVALRSNREVWAAVGSAVFSLARLSVPDEPLFGLSGAGYRPRLRPSAGDVRQAYFSVLVTLLETARDV